MTKKQKQTERNQLNDIEFLEKCKKLTPYQRLFLAYKYCPYEQWKWTNFYFKILSMNDIPGAFKKIWKKVKDFCLKNEIYMPTLNERVGDGLSTTYPIRFNDLFAMNAGCIMVKTIRIKDETLIKYKIFDIKRVAREKKRVAFLKKKKELEDKKQKELEDKKQEELKKQKSKCDGKVVEIDGEKFQLKKI
jgi:hypothetical protein